MNVAKNWIIKNEARRFEGALTTMPTQTKSLRSTKRSSADGGISAQALWLRLQAT